MGWPQATASPGQRAMAIRPATGMPSPCRSEVDILYQLRKRQTRWLNTSFVLQRGLWQRAIDDKLLGYIFARSQGVATPSVLFCDVRGPLALPDAWPASWGCCFAIKPLYGYNDFGVMLVENGVERFTGTVLRGRDDVLRHLRRQGVPRLRRSTVYVETLIRPEAGLYSVNATPPDFKFLLFGSKVASVAIIDGRKTADSCMAFVDEAYERTDVHGCVCREVNEFSPCAYRHCDRGLPPRPRQWERMVDVAKKLGEVIGIHMRIDIYASRTGLPVLGEFTPWHANGKMHCDLRPAEHAAGSVRRRNALTGAVSRVDACRLGRMWRDAGGDEGGPHDPKPPPVLRGWSALMYNEHAKCMVATRLLRPPRAARGRLRGMEKGAGRAQDLRTRVKAA